MLDKIEPQDFIIWTVMMGCITSISLGHDGIFKDILISVTGYYLGGRSEKLKAPKKNGESNHT